MYIERQEIVFNSKQWQTYFLKINLFNYSAPLEFLISTTV